MASGTSFFFTRSGLLEGVRLSFVLLPATIIFGMAFGALAQKAGLSLAEAVLFSAFVYAGASQFAALGAWQDPMTLAAGASILLIIGTVNSRLIMIGASYRALIGTVPTAQAYPLQAVTTDFTWVTGIGYIERGGRDLAVPLGAGLFIWLFWWSATAPGWLFGQAILDPRRYAIDLVLPLMFALFLVPMWKGAARAIPWLVAGLVSLLLFWLIPGHLYVFFGALAGALAGAFSRDER